MDQEIINYLSKLCKIELEAGEKEKFLHNLIGLENLVSSIKNVNTDGVSEHFEILEQQEATIQKTALRPDELKAEKSDSFETDLATVRQKTKALAPEMKDDYFVVPQVVE